MRSQAARAVAQASPIPTTRRSRHEAPRKQLNYLRALAQRTGQTFTWPTTTQDASNEINRLKGVRKTPTADRRRELRAVQDDLAAGRGDAARVRDHELSGYGSTATWAGRHDAA